MKHSDFIENKQRGSRDLPIQLYRIDEHHPEYIMPLHWHRDLEIIRVTSGEFILYINNTPYTLSAGDVAFVNCGALHRGEPVCCKYDCVVFDLSLLLKKGNSTLSRFIDPIIDGDREIRVLHSADGSKLYATINSLFFLLTSQNEHFELAVIGLLYEMLFQLYSGELISSTKLNKKVVGQTAAVASLVNWIEDNHTEHITLQILAEKAGMTPNYLCRIFKEYTGKTPIEYVNCVRIDGVCYDISRGQRNITTAAISNGYNDLSYFCKVFKKHKGMSAKNYAATYGKVK